MMVRVSASRLPLYGECSAAAALPRVDRRSEEADLGNAVHEHMQFRVELGLDDAVAKLPETARRWALSERMTAILLARCKNFEWSPPIGALEEVPLCLMRDGRVVRVKGGRGVYDVPEGALLPGTADVMWSEPEPLDVTDPLHPRCPKDSALWVVDYKGGTDAWVSPIESNRQLRALALMAARWTGAECVIPAVLFVRPGQGDWDVPETPLTKVDLEAIDVEVRELLADLEDQVRRAGAGLALRFVEGRHCQICDAQSRCSAKTAALKSFLGDLAPLRDAPLTPDQAKWYAARLTSAEAFVKRMKSALVEHVKATGAIDLGGGLVWGPNEQPESPIDAARAMPILREELGEDALFGSMKLSKQAIEDAARDVLAKQGVKKGLAPKMRKVMGRLKEAGAIKKSSTTWWHAHRPAALAEEQALAGEVDADADAPAHV